jgi:hypothetical protein
MLLHKKISTDDLDLGCSFFVLLGIDTLSQDSDKYLLFL